MRQPSARREELQGLDRMKRDFITLVAHELRTPLTSIVGMSDLILHDLYDDMPELLSMVKTICNEATGLNRFVNDTVEFMRWERPGF